MKNHGKSRLSSAGLLDNVSDNPFESRGITHKKHTVFNRKVKGEKRNVAKARSRATKIREQTLLVDYKRSLKANAFQDRRWSASILYPILSRKSLQVLRFVSWTSTGQDVSSYAPYVSHDTFVSSLAWFAHKLFLFWYVISWIQIWRKWCKLANWRENVG